jgi:hypothetical protein
VLELYKPDSFFSEPRVLGTKLTKWLHWSFLYAWMCWASNIWCLACLSGLAFSCEEQCPPDSLFTEAHEPGSKMTAQLNWFHFDWICEALYFWCHAVLACAVDLQLLRWVRTRSRPD